MVTVNINSAQIMAKVNNAKRNTQPVLDAQVMKDSNKYCPMDTGMLQKSVITNSTIGSGKLIWNTPYAKEQYYNKPNKSKQHNPFASLQWFEVAKAKNKKLWERIVNGEFSKNFK